MTGQEILDQFENIVDDDIDPTFGLFLMNAAKDEVEGGYDWNFNRGIDISKTISAGDTYLSTKALPTDFLAPRKLYVTGDINPWNLIPYEEIYRYKDIYKRWYIDHLNRVFALCGGSNPVGATIQLFYARFSPAITLTTSPVWPETFHAYLPFKMAEMYKSGIDGEEVNFRMSPSNLRIASDILRSFRLWDAKIKTIEYNSKNEIRADLSSHPDVVGQDFING